MGSKRQDGQAERTHGGGGWADGRKQRTKQWGVRPAAEDPRGRSDGRNKPTGEERGGATGGRKGARTTEGTSSQPHKRGARQDEGLTGRRWR